jgi:predicted Zn finger-like uncharacterized protein
MTDSFVTQCPHCQTSFRVSHAQLSAARGVVRCGSCLQVFNAAKQLLEQAGKEPVAPVAPAIAQTPEPAEPRAISQKQWSAAELDLDSLDLDEELARLEQREIQPTTEFGRPREDSLSARRDSVENNEEPWTTDSLFSESAADRAQAIDDLDDLDTLDTPDQEAPLKESGILARTEPSLSLELEPVEPDDEPQPPQLRLHDPLDAPLHHERLSATPTEEHDDDLPSVEPLRKRRERSEPGVRAEALQDLTDDPLQLDWQKRRSPWGRRFFWFLLILLGAGALVGQYVAYHFDELARQDQYRPWFQQRVPANRLQSAVQGRHQTAKSKAATWWSAVTRSSRVHWSLTRSSTTALPSPSRFRCWNCALPTQWPADRQSSVQARRVPEWRIGRQGRNAAADADPHRTGHPRPWRQGGELQFELSLAGVKPGSPGNSFTE